MSPLEIARKFLHPARINGCAFCGMEHDDAPMDACQDRMYRDGAHLARAVVQMQGEIDELRQAAGTADIVGERLRRAENALGELERLSQYIPGALDRMDCQVVREIVQQAKGEACK